MLAKRSASRLYVLKLGLGATVVRPVIGTKRISGDGVAGSMGAEGIQP